jgi:hypothetical protein
MSTKTAVSTDKSADRTDRPAPSHRTPTPYEVVSAHGVTDLDYTKDQTNRCHEEATDPAAKAQGAITPGEDGMDNAKRRFQSIHKRRQETAAVFEANRKKSSTI